MATVADSVGNASWINASLRAGLVTLSSNQIITFTRYVRVVLPLDGFVFWVKASLLSQASLANAMMCGLAMPNTPFQLNAPNIIEVQGSFHRNVGKRQEEDQTLGINRVVFTSVQEVQPFNTPSPNQVYIGTVAGVRYAFSAHGYFYEQAKLWHYTGDAVYPAMLTQIIDSLSAFDRFSLVVSNSLPAWLALAQFSSFAVPGFTPPPIYPSFAVPDNLPPPYISVHVDPSGTRAWGLPAISQSSTSTQLAVDRVSLTLYGLRNNAAVDFLNFVNDYTLMTGIFGLCNFPIVRDGKRTQVELSILAMQKMIDYEVNYYQTRIATVARQLIETVIPTYHPEPV